MKLKLLQNCFKSHPQIGNFYTVTHFHTLILSLRFLSNYCKYRKNSFVTVISDRSFFSSFGGFFSIFLKNIINLNKNTQWTYDPLRRMHTAA